MTASEQILARALVGSSLDSREWNGIQAQLRDRAFFSSTVEDVRRLAVMRQACAEVAAGDLSASDARLRIRDALRATGYSPDSGKEDGLQDLSSEARLNAILKMNAQSARGYVRRLESTSAGALAAFPAQELVRHRARKAERKWNDIWAEAGGRFYDGRRIALVTDEIWTKISDFGRPYPPFKWGSGMGVKAIDREEAIRLGVIRPDDPPQTPPETPGMNQGLGVRLPPGGERETDQLLRAAFGSQVSVDADNFAHWNDSLIRDMLAGTGQANARLGQGRFNPALLGKIDDEDLRARVSKGGLTISQQWMQTHAKKHKAPKGVMNLPLSETDYELIPSLWRSPDTATTHSAGELELSLETLDGSRLVLGVALRNFSPTTFYKTAAKAPSPA